MSDIASTIRYQKVLVVDDDKVDVYISIKTIREANFADEIIFKHSIRAALDYLVEMINHGGKLPDLIFLDWNFPGENSIDFLKDLKLLCKKANTEPSVVILTSLMNTDFLIKRIENEHPMVQAFLEKPLTTENLSEI